MPVRLTWLGAIVYPHTPTRIFISDSSPTEKVRFVHAYLHTVIPCKLAEKRNVSYGLRKTVRVLGFCTS